MRFAAIVTAALLLVGALTAARGADAPPTLADECAVPADFAPPVTHAYTLRNGATVVFVAVQHTRDIGDATHRQIQDAFDRYRPNMVLVEGAASSKSGADSYRKFLTEAAARQYRSGAIQETLFAVKLASDRGIAFSGWDFSPDEDYANSVGHAFAISDVIGMHLIRDKIDPFDAVGGDRAIARELDYAARVQRADGFVYADWYRKTYGDRFDQSYGTPCGRGIAGRIAKYETYRRNRNLITLITAQAKPGAVVLVEGGANHWLALRPYLESIATRAT